MSEPAILAGGPGEVPEAAPPPMPEPRVRAPSVARRGTAPTVYVAGFWRRLAAAMIDTAIVLPIALFLTWITSAVAGIHLPPGKLGGPDFWLDLALSSDPAVTTALVITLAVSVIYLFVWQATVGQTLGMRVLKTRVIDVYGDAPTYLRVGLRTLGFLVGLATLFLGFLWIGFDAEKRGLHDWIAGTYVIRATT